MLVPVLPLPCRWRCRWPSRSSWRRRRPVRARAGGPVALARSRGAARREGEGGEQARGGAKEERHGDLLGRGPGYAARVKARAPRGRSARGLAARDAQTPVVARRRPWSCRAKYYATLERSRAPGRAGDARRCGDRLVPARCRCRRSWTTPWPYEGSASCRSTSMSCWRRSSLAEAIRQRHAAYSPVEEQAPRRCRSRKLVDERVGGGPSCASQPFDDGQARLLRSSASVRALTQISVGRSARSRAVTAPTWWKPWIAHGM